MVFHKPNFVDFKNQIDQPNIQCKHKEGMTIFGHGSRKKNHRKQASPYSCSGR